MLKYIVDTHILLWYFANDRRLPRAVSRMLETDLEQYVVSVASIWEAEIKQAAGRLNPPADFYATVKSMGFPIIDIVADDAVAAAHLPAHHRDPFDRMLVAQAERRGLTLITSDTIWLTYGVPVLWARA